MGYVEQTDDPFADSDSESSFEYSATAYQSEDAFSDTDYSELEYSEISKIESANDESAAYLIIKQTFVLVINNHVFSYI